MSTNKNSETVPQELPICTKRENKRKIATTTNQTVDATIAPTSKPTNMPTFLYQKNHNNCIITNTNRNTNKYNIKQDTRNSKRNNNDSQAGRDTRTETKRTKNNRNTLRQKTSLHPYIQYTKNDIKRIKIEKFTDTKIPTKNVTKNSHAQQFFNQSISTTSIQQTSSSTATKIKKQKNVEVPTSTPLASDIGKCGLMWPRGSIANSHPAAEMLHKLSTTGCPLDCGKHWSKEHILQALKRGAHISAKEPEAAKYLHRETQEKIKGKYLKVVKWKDIKDSYPPQLKLSPVAMIPHKSRSYRCILDLSFQLRIDNKQHPSVNSNTNSRAPKKAMSQLGIVITRIITNMAKQYNTNKPFMFCKCDIKDGFWRMSVHPDDAWNFCYVLPPITKIKNIDELEIVVPQALQMGWEESPPWFSSATETARDTINYYIVATESLPEHPLEHHMIPSKITSPPNIPTKRQLIPSTKNNIKNNSTTNTEEIEVYVDDFIGMTNNTNSNNLTHLSRAILHGIHSFFPPPSVTRHNGEDPISIKKLKEGEGLWNVEKEILGWIINGQSYTIKLPPGKVSKLIISMQNMIKKKAATLQQFQELQGKLIHASLGIPNGRGLLSAIYRATINEPKIITITKVISQCLKDWIFLLSEMIKKPTSILQLVPQLPEHLGYVDSSKQAVGGVWLLDTNNGITHWVWRFQWPMEIQKQFQSADNKEGTISINDLELAGVLLAWMILEKLTSNNLKHAHVGIFCDNISSVEWATKQCTTTSVIAGHLLRVLALRQAIQKASPLHTIHIKGELNKMADIASRSFNDDRFTTTNKSFLSCFNNIFKLQKNSWKEFKPNTKMTSNVTSSLLGKPLTMEWWRRTMTKETNTGNTGQNMYGFSRKTHSSQHAPMQSKLSSSQLLLQGSGQATTAEKIRSKFSQSKMHWQPSPRPLNWLENAPQSTKQTKLTKHQWHGLLKGSGGMTHQQYHK